MIRLLPISSLLLIFDDAIVSVDDILSDTAAISYESSVLTAGEDS